MIKAAQQTISSQVTLAPGEFYFGTGHTRISTLLGSCIAITMWHPKLLVGGMCHYLLPKGSGRQRLNHGSYADEAMALFLKAINKTATRPEEYEVKVFGGGNMFRTSTQKTGVINVSKSNIDTADILLKENGFTIKSQDVGGAFHRKVNLELWSGDVWVKRGASSCNIEGK